MNIWLVCMLCILGMLVIEVGSLYLLLVRGSSFFKFVSATKVIIIGLVIINIAIVSTGYAITFGNATVDTEILNGRITGKQKERVSCEHSYSCNCITTVDSKGNSSTTCQTCYDHDYDNRWRVYTSVDQFSVSRIDKQGLLTPPAWSRIAINDPYAKASYFKNYFRISAQNLFKTEGIDPILLSKVPSYPTGVYDYRYLDRALPTDSGMTAAQLKEWNAAIWDGLKELGPAKQVNLIIIFTKQKPEFVNAIKAAWLGGKKNDVIVVLGISEYPKLEWARVISWTPNELYKVQLRDKLTELTEVNASEVTKIIFGETARGFQRLHMKDFEYLVSEVGFSNGTYVIFLILTLVISGFFYFMLKDSFYGNFARNRKTNRFKSF